MEEVFSMQSVPRLRKESVWSCEFVTIFTCSSLREGGFEYLHHSPASRKRRRKWKPMPEGINGPPCSWVRQQNVVMSPMGLGPENDCAGLFPLDTKRTV
jgi:hypothetical protein